MFIDPSDFNGQRYFVYGVNPRESITRVFEAVLRPGDCILDVGANVGYFSVAGSRLVGNKGEVHAFEASPLLKSRLGIVQNNPNRNITVYNLAVTDGEGELTFNCVISGHSGKSSIRDVVDAATKPFSVRTISLDSLLPNLSRVRLIKLDIEGAEMMALKGATRLIRRDRPLLIIEVSDRFLQSLGSSAAELLAFLRAFDYELFRIGEYIEPLVTVPKDQWDILAAPREESLQGLFLERQQP